MGLILEPWPTLGPPCAPPLLLFGALCPAFATFFGDLGRRPDFSFTLWCPLDRKSDFFGEGRCGSNIANTVRIAHCTHFYRISVRVPTQRRPGPPFCFHFGVLRPTYDSLWAPPVAILTLRWNAKQKAMPTATAFSQNCPKGGACGGPAAGGNPR